jgi:hypothetical protein
MPATIVRKFVAGSGWHGYDVEPPNCINISGFLSVPPGQQYP